MTGRNISSFNLTSFKSPDRVKNYNRSNRKCSTEKNRKKNKAEFSEQLRLTKDGKKAKNDDMHFVEHWNGIYGGGTSKNDNGQQFNLKIKTHEIEQRLRPFCVRCQSAEKGSIKQQINDINFVEHWNGIYGGARTEQAQGYLNPTVSENKFLKVYTKDKIKVLELTGDFMSSSEITGNTKASAIINLLKKPTLDLKPETIEAMKSTTKNEKEKEFPDELHLSRLLKNLGYDAIITEENEDDTEAIILDATKFYETTAATVLGSRERHGIFTRFNSGDNTTNEITEVPLPQVLTIISPESDGFKRPNNDIFMTSPNSEAINRLVTDTSPTSNPTSVNIDRLIAANTSTVMSPELNQNNNPSDEQPKTPTYATQSNGFNFTEGDTDHEASSSDSGSDSEDAINRLVYNGSTPTRPSSTTKKKQPRQSPTKKQQPQNIFIGSLDDRLKEVN